MDRARGVQLLCVGSSPTLFSMGTVAQSGRAAGFLLSENEVVSLRVSGSNPLLPANTQVAQRLEQPNRGVVSGFESLLAYIWNGNSVVE